MKARKLRSGCILVLMFLLAAVVCFPVLFVLVGSFMSTGELERNLAPVVNGTQGWIGWSLLPAQPTMRPYVQLLIDSPEFYVLFWNSVKITLGILAGQLLFGMPAAWGLAKLDFGGRKALYWIYVILMLFPFQTTMLSSYLILNRLQLVNTHAGIILPAMFSTFPVFIMYRFFKGVPDELIESAKLDGAGHLQIFFRIGIPLGSSGVISALILNYLECWNMIEQPMTFLKDQALWPLSLYLPNITLEQAGFAFASAVVVLLPSLCVFFAGQEYLEQGIVASAIKA